MIIAFTRARLFLRYTLHAILGIFSELFLVYSFIVIGLVVCFLWWSIFK